MSFRCPKCHSPGTSVVDTRSVRRGTSSGVNRRRRCTNKGCEHRFNTRESVMTTIEDIGLSQHNVMLAIERAKTSSAYDEYLNGIIQKIQDAIRQREG